MFKIQRTKLIDDKERSNLRATDTVQGQTYERIFAQNRGYYVSYPSNILQRVGFTNSSLFSAWGVFFWVFSGSTL